MIFLILGESANEDKKVFEILLIVKIFPYLFLLI